jgi:hypothetical protein
MPSEIISEQRATSNRNGARDHPGMPGDFRRNPRCGREAGPVARKPTINSTFGFCRECAGLSCGGKYHQQRAKPQNVEFSECSFIGLRSNLPVEAIDCPDDLLRCCLGLTITPAVLIRFHPHHREIARSHPVSRA